MRTTNLVRPRTEKHSNPSTAGVWIPFWWPHLKYTWAKPANFSNFSTLKVCNDMVKQMRWKCRSINKLKLTTFLGCDAKVSHWWVESFADIHPKAYVIFLIWIQVMECVVGSTVICEALILPDNRIIVVSTPENAENNYDWQYAYSRRSKSMYCLSHIMLQRF